LTIARNGITLHRTNCLMFNTFSAAEVPAH